MTDILRLSWTDFDAAVLRLSGLVMPGRSGVMGVPRGGLPVAVALSHLTNLPLVTVPDQQTLIVDDIADSGRTLSAYPNHQRLVLVRRSGARCRAQAALYLTDEDARWVMFPWENPSNVQQDRARYAAL